MTKTIHWPTAVGSFVLASALFSAAQADDFRIESKTYIGKEKAPCSESVTLFRAGIVYDYLQDPQSIAVFDKARGRFVLLDPVRKVKTEVQIADVLTFIQTMQQTAAKSPNKLIRFAAKPEFHSDFDEESERLTLSSPLMTYEVQTAKAQNIGSAQQYREFSDWYVRLNAMMNPGSTPPFARLALDEHLANRELVATRVLLTLPATGKLGAKSQEFRSEHKVSWRLLQRDLSKIAETANQLTAFRQVSFNDFRGAAEGHPAVATKR